MRAEDSVRSGTADRAIPGQLDLVAPVGLKAGRGEHGVVPVRRPDAVRMTRSRRPTQHPVGEVDADVCAQPAQVSLGPAQEVRRIDHRYRTFDGVVQLGLLDQPDFLGDHVGARAQ